MSRSDSEDLASAPLSPTAGSEPGSTESLRGWTILKLMAELWCRAIPYPAMARKAKLFRLLLPTPAAAAPGTQQASLLSISSAPTQLHTMIGMLTAAVSGMQARVLEVCLSVTPLDMFAAPILALPPTGMLDTSSTIFPAHLVPAGIRKDILEGKDINLASLLISVQDLAKNKSYTSGDVFVVLKAKDPRRNSKLSITEFVLAFGMFRDMLCSANPVRREEMDLYLHAVVDAEALHFTITIVRSQPEPQPNSPSCKPALIGALWTTSCSAATLRVCIPRFVWLASPLCTWQTGALTRTPAIP